MRLALFFLLGLFLWAGTVSIRYSQEGLTVPTSSGHTCLLQSAGDHLWGYLTKGTITSIHDDGKILTIGLSPNWKSLSPAEQQKAYKAIACYSTSLERPFQTLIPEYLSPR